MEKLYRCCKCGYQMISGEVWISDNTKDNRVFCYRHAPNEAIRLKDTLKPSLNSQH